MEDWGHLGHLLHLPSTRAPRKRACHIPAGSLWGPDSMLSSLLGVLGFLGTMDQCSVILTCVTCVVKGLNHSKEGQGRFRE